MLFSAAALVSTAMAKQPSVNVPGLGALNGLNSDFSGVAEFRGVPFAKPPVGSLRWQPPVPFDAWEGARDATKFGFSCPQLPGLATQPTSEDCLYLNIAMPEAQLSSDEKLSVMFWIHGGAHVLGDAAAYQSSMASLVTMSENQVVVVATNYRLGVLGYSASSELMARSSDGSAGNFGIQDQTLAMVWVRDHIASFGGDASKVTIFGESAGGNSVMTHLSFPASAGLFHRAIIESGTYNAGAQPLADAEKAWSKAKSEASCDDLDCLLALDSSTLIQNQGNVLLAYPVVDGVAQLASGEVNIKQGNYQKVDVLIGSNRDEIAMFALPVLPSQLSYTELDAILEALVIDPFRVAKINKLYEPANYEYPQDLGNYSEAWWRAIRIGTDGGGLGLFSSQATGVFGLGHCGARHLARDLKAAGSAHVYQYLFEKGFIVQHGDEISYAFGATWAFTDESDKRLATAMGKYWSSFAINGVPTAEGFPDWPEYDAESDEVLRLDSDIRIGQKLRADQCDFWQEHPIDIDPNILGNILLPHLEKQLWPKPHQEEAPMVLV